MRLGPRFDQQPGLAVDWVSNAAGTVWEIHLRQGVHWHDGKPFTADDVIYTFRWRGKPGNLGQSGVSAVRLHDLKKLGKYVVQVPLTRPVTRLSDYMLDNLTSIVVQNGATDFSNPIGTGAFLPQSFTPGQQSVGVRNPNYWDQGKPYVDEFQLTSLTDPVAGVNALAAGQLDAVYPVPFPIAKAHQAQPGGYELNLQIGGFAQTIYMRTDRAPFNDPRVRLAMKLIPDRTQMIDVALSGFGQPGNDLFGFGLPDYASHIPQRTQDLEQAKSLLKSAGRSGLSVILYTSTALPGLTDAATVFAQQAKGAGVTVQTQVVPPAAYFNPTLRFLKMPFAQDSWQVPALGPVYNEAVVTGGSYNESHESDKITDKLVESAEATLDSKQAAQLWQQAQERFWKSEGHSGGHIIWGLRHSVTGRSSNVMGMAQGWYLPLGDMKVWDWWLAS